MLSWTALFAQTGKTIITNTGDTITCYTNNELKKIAQRVVRANECDTLLSIAENRVDRLRIAVDAFKLTIALNDSIVNSLEYSLEIKEDIVKGKDQQINNLNDILQKEQRKKRWILFGWIGSSAILTGLLTFSVISN